MKMAIWEKQIWLRISKFLLAFLSSIYLAYLLVDFSIHSTHLFSYSSVGFTEIISYYLRLFVVNLSLFLPLSFLLAMIKVLHEMNLHRELIVLQMAGISIKKINRPLLSLALILSFILLANMEFFLPSSIAHIDSFKGKHLRKNRSSSSSYMHPVTLKNGSKLIYQSRDHDQLFDVFWIRSEFDLFHIKYLTLPKPGSFSKGQYVDHFVKTKEGQWKKNVFYPLYEFKEIQLKEKKGASPPLQNQSMTSLSKQLFQKAPRARDKAALSSHLNFKLIVSFLPCWIVFSIAPFCLRFSRYLPIFFVCVFSLFSFVVFFTLMESALILGENRVLLPYWAFGPPLLFLFFGIEWMKNYWEKKLS